MDEHGPNREDISRQNYQQPHRQPGKWNLPVEDFGRTSWLNKSGIGSYGREKKAGFGWIAPTWHAALILPPSGQSAAVRPVLPRGACEKNHNFNLPLTPAKATLTVRFFSAFSISLINQDKAGYAENAQRFRLRLQD
jgi:hypothetical protein